MQPQQSFNSKSALFRQLLFSNQLEFLMEGHNGISAKIVENTGFKGIWASGLSISASLGVRDSNEASWTQVLEVLEFMSDATSIPILLDGDTGYGNFNNMRRLVRKLEQRDVAAVCIEDKLFPKTNSFIGECQPLAPIDEFCGKIKAGKDSQLTDDFSIIARVEAFIAGLGFSEAIKRAEAYHEAGADGILIHSKSNRPNEILLFLNEWGNRCPVVIVPTTYYSTPTEMFRNAGASVIIWANHNMRASITAMQNISKRIFNEQGLCNVEGEIASVKDIFELTQVPELKGAEKKYLTSSPGKEYQAVILAASRGSEIHGFTKEKPKAMLEVRGIPLLKRLLNTLKDNSIHNITVVRGYKKEAINYDYIKTVDNEDFDKTGEAASLYCANDRLGDPCIISFGDILFRKYILDRMIDSEGDIVLAVDSRWQNEAFRSQNRAVDLVTCSKPFKSGFFDEEPVHVNAFHQNVDASTIDGRWIGLARLSKAGGTIVRNELALMKAEGCLVESSLSELFSRLLQAGHKINVVYVNEHWLDINDTADLVLAQNFNN